MRNGPVEDMMQFKGSCPDELIQMALDAQRIFAEDLMPLKKKLLQPHHLQACIDAFDLYFDNQYEESLKFCTEQTSQEILKTRGFTIGVLVPFVLCMTSAHAELYRADDPCLTQIGILVALFHDIMGLFKDLDALNRQEPDDSSAFLNLVRLSMREHGLSETEALRLSAQRLNYFSHSYEFFINSYAPALQQFYRENLRFCFNFYDYHLMGILGNPNNRYGWSIV
ncbi:hypothetical protein N7490_003539 [Penicillium lividum]|nr:hypothetical protein N7490_003539 [Penicillium lividum]